MSGFVAVYDSLWPLPSNAARPAHASGAIRSVSRPLD